MKPRSLTPLCLIPRSSSRSTVWANVACESANAMWCTQPGSVGVRLGSAVRSSLVKTVIRRPSPGSKYRWLSEALSRFGCSKTNGMPSTPSQKSIDVCRPAPTRVMWWTPWLWSLRMSGLRLVGDGVLGRVRHHEADRVLLLLGQVAQQAGRPGEDRHGLDDRRAEAQVQEHRRHRHRDVQRQRLAPCFVHGVAERLGKRHVGAGDPSLVGELEDALG